MISLGFFVLMLIGLSCVVLAAIGSKVIQEVAWHDLEEYCERRKSDRLFDEIHDEHDDVILGMETLRSLGNVLCVIGAVCWFANLNTSAHLGLGSAILVLFGCILLFFAVAAWLPSALAAVWGTEILYHYWRVFDAASSAVRPLSRGAAWMEFLLRRISARPEVPTDEEAFEDEVMAIVTEGLHDGHLGEETREMIEGVIELGDHDVGDIMTPRSKIDAMPSDLSWEAALKFVAECGRTRIPVYGEDLDDIAGVLYVKDLLSEMSADSRQPWTELLREPRFVSRTQRLNELLQDFRDTRNHVAIVRDEYGSTDGLVTIEDVLEEIVGEIEDESDQEEHDRITWIDDWSVNVDGDTHLSELNERLGVELPEPDDYETIAGFVIDQLRRIPKPGERLNLEAIRLTVVEANDRRINRVRLETPDRDHPFLSNRERSNGAAEDHASASAVDDSSTRNGGH